MKNKKMWLLSTQKTDEDNVAILTFRIEGQNALSAKQLCAIEQLYENWSESQLTDVIKELFDKITCNDSREMTEERFIYAVTEFLTSYKDDVIEFIAPSILNENIEEDNPTKRILDAPAKYSLIDIFNELKFGRPKASQDYLDKCIMELTLEGAKSEDEQTNRQTNSKNLKNISDDKLFDFQKDIIRRDEQLEGAKSEDEQKCYERHFFNTPHQEKKDNVFYENKLWRNYMDNVNNNEKWMKEITLNTRFPSKSYATYSEEEFLEKIKTDIEFCKMWGYLSDIYNHEKVNNKSIRNTQETDKLITHKELMDFFGFLITNQFIKNLYVKPKQIIDGYLKWYQTSEDAIAESENVFYRNYVDLVKQNPEGYLKWTKTIYKEGNTIHEPYSESTFEMLMAKNSKFRKLFEIMTTKDGTTIVRGKDVPIDDFFYVKNDCYILIDKDTSGDIFVTLNREYATALEVGGNYSYQVGEFIENKDKHITTSKLIKNYCFDYVCPTCADYKTCNKKCIGECLPTQELDNFGGWLSHNKINFKQDI